MTAFCTLILAAAPLVAANTAEPETVPAAVADAPSHDILPADDGRGTNYIVDKTDNICGLDEPRQLTNPAKVDYDALLAVTPEVKEIREEKIDPDSSRGITLMTKARARVLRACETVRAAGGYCSVWKKIARRDKKKLPVVTADVKKEIAQGDPLATG